MSTFLDKSWWEITALDYCYCNWEKHVRYMGCLLYIYQIRTQKYFINKAL